MITSRTGELLEVILPVLDINAQVAFYRDILGLRVKEPVGVNDFRDFYQVQLQSGACTLILQVQSPSQAVLKQAPRQNTPRLIFCVPDIHACHAQLLQSGALIQEMSSPTPGALRFDGVDPEGNLYAVENSKSSVLQRLRPEIQLLPHAQIIPLSSFRGRCIQILRYNKFVIGLEILCFIVLVEIASFKHLIEFYWIFLLLFGLVWLQGKTWGELGLRSPNSLKICLLSGIGLGLFFTVLVHYVITPTINHLVPPVSITGNILIIHNKWAYFASDLFNIWTSAAFMEEIMFRAYLLNRFTDLFGTKIYGWIFALLFQAIIFGSAHGYEGLSGMINAATYGFFAGLIYLANKKNIWSGSIMHGLIDTLLTIFQYWGF
ncbi:CPBP family glutamic-type intramembrane protease [Tengunoibacter tsumagoiensis]|uniref:CAAX prenyl protease 2/Lysostaphin resistance protein A-like domain-containing protein n=1 Tax=Tengunoibacter tsumagoiensis TaxID=2014871 RepID=A0A402A2H4_9CHLR|nr:CPBP family glutamic-type intramembrane protease [Tengunoibacter tsumagoiensis]GCE13249.1 hypothetical protein KTT_31080 [Tengunoibacter tsumagoiensis]